MSSATASSTIATSSTAWSSAILTTGVVGGGTSRDYLTGIEGWGGDAVSSLGVMGLEWTSVHDPARRQTFEGSVSSESLVPGGASSWESLGYLSSDPLNVVYTTKTVELDGDQARWSVRLQSLDPGVMTDKRIFLETELPASYQSVYSSPGAGTLLIQDSSHQHPTLIAHAVTTAGTLQWGGQGSFTQPLSDGELHPTAYVHSTGEMDYTVTLTVGIVDYDPCSGPDAATFAQAQAGVFGVAWPSLTSCLSSPSWSVMADGNPSEPSTLVFLDAMTPLGSGATRALEITGLPTGVTWRRLPDSSLSLVLELTAHEDVTPGQYPLTLSTATHTTLGGVTVVSEQSQTTGTLEVLSPPPPVIDVVDDPPPAASPSSGTSVPSPEPEVVATPEVAQPPRTPLPPAPVPADTEVVSEAPLVDDPSVPVVPLLREPPVAFPSERIPEPQAASALLGISAAVVATAGGLFAAIRRRRNREEHSREAR